MGENGQRFVGIAKSSRVQTVGTALDDPLPKNSVVCKAGSLSTGSPVGPFLNACERKGELEIVLF